MVAKQAVRKQQNTSRMEKARAPLAGMLPVAEAFHAAVGQCVEDAETDAVHRVRTGSRRLQAMLESLLREAGQPAEALREPTRLWLRQLKKIRQAAGAVRDLDVQRKLLEGWIGNVADGSQAGPLQHQAGALDGWLKDQRKRLAHGMQKEMSRRQQRLLEQQDGLFAAISGLHRGKTAAMRPADAVALDEFVRSCDAMPVLDAENLHDFRKATKKARYVAEAGSEEPTSVAKALKRIQDAIGDWHDWVCLQIDAKEALGQDAPELSIALQGEVERHFAAAMKVTQTMRSRLLGEWLATKRPVGRVGVEHRRIGAQRTA